MLKMFNVGEGRYHTMVFTIGPGEVSQGGRGEGMVREEEEGNAG